MPSDAHPAPDSDRAEAREAGRWNFRPQVPLAQNPLFQWPPRPAAIYRWYAAFWLEISTTTLCFVLALGAYFLILPPLAEMQSLAWGWVIKVWLANLVPQVICAGTLHYWLIMRQGQGDRTKYDPRDQARDICRFEARIDVDCGNICRAAVEHAQQLCGECHGR